VVGAITHCAGYRAAVAAPVAAVMTVGVDAEPHQPLPGDALGAVSLPEERDWIARQAGAEPGICWDRLLYSAKETVYKASAVH
jgi:4'-phosphopantetheinyl transferase EntD